MILLILENFILLTKLHFKVFLCLNEVLKFKKSIWPFRLFLRQELPVLIWLSWNLLCSQGWAQIHDPPASVF